MDIGALGDGDQGKVEFFGELSNGAGIGINPRAEDGIERELFAEIEEGLAKGSGDEAMVPTAADFGEVGNGKEVGFEDAVFGAWGSEGGAEGESGAEGDDAGIPAIIEGVEDGSVVESAVGFLGIGEEIRDEKKPHYLGEWRRRETIAMISVEVGVIGVALFGGVEDIDHFASGEVMEAKMGVGVSELAEGLVEMAHGLAEEHGRVLGVSAVGMEFNESPVGATFYGDVGFLPKA